MKLTDLVVLRRHRLRSANRMLRLPTPLAAYTPGYIELPTAEAYRSAPSAADRSNSGHVLGGTGPPYYFGGERTADSIIFKVLDSKTLAEQNV